MIEAFFVEAELDEIWLTFPDPRHRKRDVKRRLTNSRFLDMYKKILKPEGVFRFKTDNTPLFDYTIEELQSRNDIKELEVTYDYTIHRYGQSASTSKPASRKCLPQR